MALERYTGFLRMFPMAERLEVVADHRSLPSEQWRTRSPERAHACELLTDFMTETITTKVDASETYPDAYKRCVREWSMGAYYICTNPAGGAPLPARTIGFKQSSDPYEDDELCYAIAVVPGNNGFDYISREISDGGYSPYLLKLAEYPPEMVAILEGLDPQIRAVFEDPAGWGSRSLLPPPGL